MSGRTLILLSCSRDKSHGGVPFDDVARRFSSVPGLGSKFLCTRNEIFDLLHGVPERLYDEDQKGGFRNERGANQALRLGPDFGGQDHGKAAYQPAYERYNGRFFKALNNAAPNLWNEVPNHSDIEILFVSGLYGLVYWNEVIQEYDCHFNDHRESDRTQVADIWRPALTLALSDFLYARAKAGDPVRYIYDLLSEKVYQDVFDWGKLQGVSLHHRIFQGVAGPDILPWVARILANRLPRFCESTTRFRNGIWNDYNSGDGPTIKFGFESEDNPLPLATREGEIDQARRFIESSPELHALSPEIREELALAEHSWRKAEFLERFDFGVLIVSYAKSVERWLRSALPDGRPEGKKIQRVVRESRHLGPLSEDIDKLWKLRGEGGAHPGPKRTKIDVEQARYLALRILSQGVLIQTRMKLHGRKGKP